jgi:hypothetical protein
VGSTDGAAAAGAAAAAGPGSAAGAGRNASHPRDAAAVHRRAANPAGSRWPGRSPGGTAPRTEVGARIWPAAPADGRPAAVPDGPALADLRRYPHPRSEERPVCGRHRSSPAAHDGHLRVGQPSCRESPLHPASPGKSAGEYRGRTRQVLQIHATARVAEPDYAE